MTPTSLFNLEELTEAFAMVFRERDVAATVAAEWFDLHADATDSDGRVLYPADWDDMRGEVVVARERMPSQAEADDHERRYFTGWSDEQKRELLMGFSDFHFALVALVSPAAHERMRIARGLSPESAERSRRQMLRITAALRDGGSGT